MLTHNLALNNLSVIQFLDGVHRNSGHSAKPHAYLECKSSKTRSLEVFICIPDFHRI